MNNAQLPDLLNGTVNNNTMNLEIDPKHLLKNLGNFGSMSNHGEFAKGFKVNFKSNLMSISGENTHDDWESAFKYLMNNKKHYEDQQQQEEWLRFQEMRKHSNMSSGLGLNQFNMFGSKLSKCFPIPLFSRFVPHKMKIATSTTCSRRMKSIA